MKKNIQRTSLFGLSIAALMVLPSCRLIDWIQEKFSGVVKPITKTELPEKKNQVEAYNEVEAYFVPEDGSKVLASMNGRPLVTEKSIAKDIKSLGDSNQELKMALALYGEDEIKRGLTLSKVSGAIYERFIKDQGIDRTKEYQEGLDRMMKAIEDQYNQMYFVKSLPVTISEADKREWYEKNMNTEPNLRLSEGGIKAMGISFDTEQKAKEFLTKAQEASGDLTKAAQAATISADMVKDFNLVNAESIGIDEAVKNAIINFTSFPAVELVKTDAAFWVVSGTGKEEAKYRPYEQVSSGIAQLLERTKRSDAAGRKMDELRKEFNIVIDEGIEKPMEEPQAITQPTQRAPQQRPAQPNKQAPISAAKPV